LGPDLTSGQWLWGDGSLAAIAHTITVGVPHPRKYGAPMPPMGGAELSSSELSAVAAYGAQGKDPVPPNADLHFEIELLDVKG